ncbi:MAG: SBBP repeat-containing protein [Candidatus Hermodarchaeota archaeon]
MLRCFWMLQSVRLRIPLSLVLLVSLPLACLGGLSLYEGVHQPLERIELVSNPGQQGIQSNIMDALQSLGHHFKENKGQLSNSAIRYYYSQADFGVAFTDTSVIYRLTGDVSTIIALRFEEANSVRPVGRKMYPHVSNYFLGTDPNQWVTGVRSYAEVVYPEVYEGIDLVYYFTSEGLKYDVLVKPGADPSVIRFRYEGIQRLTLDTNGAVLVHTEAGVLRDTHLWMYQDTPQGYQTVTGVFNIYDSTSFGFQVLTPYSSLLPLVIDPLVWSTFLGGTGVELGYAIAIDSTNNVYVTGFTMSTDFPTTSGAIDETYNSGEDVFVCKFNADGTSLIWSTFLGGSGDEEVYGITLDSANNVYVTGVTLSVDFPTTPGAYNETDNGGADVFVCKLSADGTSLVYSTFLGGSTGDSGNSLAVDSAGNTYVTGITTDAATDFPTTPGAYDETHNGAEDVFVCKLSTDGSSLLYSTFLGGSDYDEGYGLALDSAGNAYVTGTTGSADFPTTPGAYNETDNGGLDVFVCKLSTDGSALVYSTFLGGSGNDRGYVLALDNTGNAYVTGETQSTDFPTTPGAINETYNGNDEVFVCKLSTDGSALLYSTFLGGSMSDRGYGIAVDSAGNACVTGYTMDAATDFPTTPGAINETHNGGADAFVCKLNADGSSLLYSTFLGGSDDDGGYGLALDSANNVYVTGYTMDAATDFPTTPGAINETHNGGADAFVCKISFYPPTIDLISPVNESIHQSGTTIDLSIDGIDGGVSHVLYNWDGGTNTTLASPYNLTLPSGDGQHVLHVYVNDTVGNWAVQTYVFTTDDTGPTITLTSPTNGTTGAPGLVIDLSITDLTGVSQVLYSWDGTSNVTLTAPYDLTLPSSEGQHILKVYAKDTLGNWASQTYVFTTEEPMSTTSTSTTSTTTPFTNPGLELLTVLATIGLLVLYIRKKRQTKIN